MFDFPVEIEDLSKVPAEYQSLYEQENDQFKLLDILRDKISNTEISQELEELQAVHTSLSDQLAAYEAIAETPQTLAEKMAQLENDAVENVSALSKKDNEITALTLRNDAYLIDTVATEAIRDAKGDVPLLLPHLRAAVQVVARDGERFLQVNHGAGERPIKENGHEFNVVDLVQEMKSSPVFSRAFDGDIISGGGMSPSGTGARITAVSRNDHSAVNSRLEEIAAGKITVSM